MSRKGQSKRKEFVTLSGATIGKDWDLMTYLLAPEPKKRRRPSK